MQKGISSAKRRIKKWAKENKVLDVVIFGSSARGKTHPNDVDLCIIIKDDDEKKSLDLVDSLGRLTDQSAFDMHISIMVISSFISGNTLVKTLLNEGISVLNGQKLSSMLGFQSMSVFVYTLKHFSPSKRVKFHYLLKGRYGSEGILKEVEGEFLGTGSILVPAEKEDTLKEIFDGWDVKYQVKRILLS